MPLHLKQGLLGDKAELYAVEAGWFWWEAALGANGHLCL